MQTGLVGCLPGVDVEFTVKVSGFTWSTDRNDIVTLAVAVPLNEPSAFCVKAGVLEVSYFPLKLPSNTLLAVATWFAEASVTPANTAASSEFCICVFTALNLEK